MILADSVGGGQGSQLSVGGLTDTRKALWLSFDTTSNVGRIEAGIAGVSWNNLLLNPLGGFIGMGMTNPQTSLDVAGTIRCGGSISPGSGVGMEIHYNAPLNLGTIIAYGRDGTGAKALHLGCDGASGLRVMPSGVVGVNQNAPVGQFHIKGGNNPTLRLETLGTISTGGGCYIDFVDPAGRSAYIGFGGGANVFTFQKDGAGYFNFGQPNLVVGLGAPPHSGSALTLFNGSPNTALTSNQLFIGESSNNTAYGLNIGFGAFAGWAGCIQTITGGVGGPLHLNPAGGQVAVNFNNTGPYTVSTFNVNGWMAISSNATTHVTLGSDIAGATNPNTFGGLFIDGNLAFRIDCLSGGVAWRNVVANLGGGNFGVGVAVPGYKVDVAGVVNSNTGFRCTAKGQTLLGNSLGGVTALQQTDANILLYSGGTSNWAGIGTDVSGNMWFRTGLSGTPNAAMVIGNGGGVGLANTGPVYVLHLGTDSAAKPGSNVWIVASDRRLKRDIRPYKEGLDTLLKLQPISWEYNGECEIPDGLSAVGFSAQDVEPIIPQCVHRRPGRIAGEDTEVLALNTGELQYMMMNALRELNERLRILEGV